MSILVVAFVISLVDTTLSYYKKELKAHLHFI